MKKILYLAALALLGGNAAPEKIEFEARESYPEGVAYSKPANAYFVSSARLGTIGKVTPEGKYSVFYTDPTLKSTYGLKISPDGKLLYACVSDANYSKFKSPDTYRKMARLISVDIKSAKKVSDVDLSKLVPGKHFANDFTFDDKGNAYITDSFANAIYKVDNKGKASLFSQNDIFKTAGVGLNGIAWHADGYLLVASSGRGSLYKVDLKTPATPQKVQLPQYLMNADGLLLTDKNTLVLVQNGGVNKVYELSSKDGWKTAVIARSTGAEQRFSYPSTATLNGTDAWVVSAKFNELNDSVTVASTKFDIQKAQFKPVK